LTAIYSLLIVIPMLFGLIFLLTKEKHYKFLSYFLTALCSAFSIAVTVMGPQSYEISGTVFTIMEDTIVVVEVAMVLFFVYISIKHKRLSVILLSALQGLILLYTLMFTTRESTAHINIDKLSIIMLLIINIVGTLIIIFANGYMNIYEHHRHMKSKQKIFFLSVAAFLGAMNALVICDSLSWILFFWEITTMISFVLISYNGDEEAFNSGFRALGLNIIGGIAFSLGNLLLHSELEITTLSELSSRGALSGKELIPIILLCIAAFVKSAQLPFQSWLLGAMVAPTPVSALLHSSTMVNAGIFMIIKMSPAYTHTWLGTFIALYGGFCFVLCSGIAISQNNAKRVLAYSTIANLGLIISSAGMGTTTGVSAAMILLIFHAISKALLFMTTGQTEHTINSRSIDDMPGLIKIAPGLTLITAFGILSMILPPFGLLVTKWLSIEAAAANPVLVIFLAFGSGFTNIYYIRWICAILSAPTEKIKTSYDYDKNVYVPLVVLCILILGTSIAMTPLFNYFVSPEINNLLHLENPLWAANGSMVAEAGTFNNTLVLTALFLVLSISIVFKNKLTSSAKIKGAYLCGENNPIEASSEAFRSFDGSYVKSEVSNVYLRSIFDEKLLNRFGYVISILALLGIMIGGLL
jgi:ech hydrogenase subunit A